MGIVNREYERPKVCEPDYAWDGEQWCFFRDGETAALVETSLAKKRPKAALPALCASNLEKRGSWCYDSCPVGYERIGSRCKSLCGESFPAESPLMCGRNQGELSAAIGQMVVGTVTQAITLSYLVVTLTENGLANATVLSETMQALIDMGKPFAHPTCLV